MLIIERRKDDRIVVEVGNGQQVEVIISSVCRGRVKVGIVAPREMRVSRKDGHNVPSGN